jgi:hypothetical protein
MRTKSLLTITLALSIIILLAWSPWLTVSSAKVHAVESFNKSWEFVADGCGTMCKGCGAIEAKRIPFGVKVTLEYGCGMMPADSSEYHKQTTGFVSALGTVHGFPSPK